jgi:hypothetical protein
MAKKVLIDIMENGRFICQLKYDGMPFPEMIDGEIIPVYDSEDMERFVYEKRPSLRGKDIRIEFSNQKA